jgi:small-conductance mechanosensitive channel
MTIMNTLAANGLSFPILLAYGLLILLYLLILKLLINLLQQMGDKHMLQRSVIDRDIHQTMTNRVETSMHAFDIYSVAIVIAKGGIAVLAMAAVMVLLVLKVGVLATMLLVIVVILLLYAYNQWVRSREKDKSIRGEIRKYVQKSGSIGMILLLSISLVVLLFVMILIH